MTAPEINPKVATLRGQVSPVFDIRGNSRGVFGRKDLQDLKKAYFVLSTRRI